MIIDFIYLLNVYLLNVKFINIINICYNTLVRELVWLGLDVSRHAE